MKKQIMSIAAIAAIFTTGINAYDAQRSTGIVGLETSPTTFKVASMTTGNIVTAGTAIAKSITGAGDALIYPAYYSQNGWSTEFSVINNSSTEAVIAKVVLYSAVDSKELRDFNIYLSQNDVFRATIENGKLVSTDSSTRASKQDSVRTNSGTQITATGYERTDTAPMASESAPFETTVDEAVGYIAVFAMAQAATGGVTNRSTDAGYHSKHNQLWRDYRHLLDQCRGAGWRTTSNNFGGIFINGTMNTPNVDLGNPNIANNQKALLAGLAGGAECGRIITTQDTSASRSRVVEFKSPMIGAISGSLLVKGDDSKGTRSMLLQATPISNFTNGADDGMLWTEGELANITDRCLADATTTAAASDVKYDDACLIRDTTALNIGGLSTKYEFRDAENSQLLITQPYKRTILQIQNARASGSFGQNLDSLGSYYNSVRRGTTGTKNIKDYGQFSLGQPDIYDDNENLSINSSDGYIVSPAPILASTPGIPNELSVFNPLGTYNDSVSGFARIRYNTHAHGIVTQMSASEVGGTHEVNWIYPVTNQ